MLEAQVDIARRFSQAASMYDSAATVQHQARAFLYHLATDIADGAVVVDIGSGSGAAAAYWQQQGAYVVALDVAMGMLQHSRGLGRAQAWLAANAEALPLADASVDVCFSNLALQWCSDQTQAWHEIFRVLKPGGMALVSSLAQGSMQPLQSAWASVDNQVHSHSFMPQEYLQASVAALPWQAIHTHACTKTFYFAHLKDLLQSLRQVGANHVAGRSLGLMGKHKWCLFSDAYHQYCNEQGQLPLDYRVVYWRVYK